MNDVIIIGAGIVGLATALKLKELSPQLNVLVLDKEDNIARHQTGNNSGVIHSGIYYKPGSLRAVNCKRGYDMLLEFAKQENIPFEICGKIIVAADKSELQSLQNIYERGIQNGLTGLTMLNADELKQHEPYITGIKGIFVPQTGIIDYTEVSKKYASKFLAMGGTIALNKKVVGLKQQVGSTTVLCENGDYSAKLVINCAGLYSDKIARMVIDDLDVQIVPFRGEYFVLKKEKQYLVKNLIYPVPNSNFPFLGVHFTRFIEGGIEAGPNAVLAYAREGYTKSAINFSELLEILSYSGFRKLAAKYWRIGAGEFYRSYSKSAFTKALQKLIPEIKKEDLEPGGAGVRASATSIRGEVVDDFIFRETENMIHVLNSPSPAATASLSIGLTIAEMALNKINK